MADSNSSTSTTTGGSNGAGAHIHHHHTHSVPHHHHHHHHSVNHHNSHGTSNSTSAGAGKRQSSDAKTGGGSVGAGKMIHRTTSESLRLGGNGTATNDVGHAAASTNSSNSTSSSTSPATATAAGGGGGGNSRKAKTSSFQITSVTVGTRNVGPDNGEDSADDLDESHTDDNSRITDLENETPSFSEDTFSKEDLFIARDALGTAPVIPTSSQYGLAIVAPGELTNMPGGVGGGGGNGSPQGGKDSDAQLHANADLKQHEVDLKDMNHRNERFKVVKIESTEPFKRGRWMCMDYLDHTTLQTNNVNNATNKEGENGGGGGTGDSGVGLNENHVDQTEMTDESPNQQPHSQFLGSSGTGTGSTFAAISSTSTSPAQSISTTVEAATFMHGQTMSIPVTSTAVDSSATGSPAVAQSLPPQQLQQILSQQTNNSNSGILPGTPVSQSQFYPAASSVATAAEATSTQPVFSAAVAATMNQHSGQGHTLPAGLPSSVLQQPANNATNVPQQPMTIGHVDATLLMTNVGGGNPTTDAGQNQFIGESGSAPSNLAPNTDAVAPATTPVFAGVVNTTTATGGTDSGSSTTPVQEVNAAVLAATLQTSSPGSGTPSQTAPSSSSLMSRGAAAAAAAAALGGDQILNVAAAIIGEDAQSVGEDSESASGTSVAIDNKIEQAMDLVKSHLMFAVREEVEVLKERIAELMDRINQLEVENSILKANASQETLAQLAALSASAPKPAPNPNAVNPPAP